MIQKTFTVTDIFNKATNWYFKLNLGQQLFVLVGVGLVLHEIAPKRNLYFSTPKLKPKPLPRKYFSESTKKKFTKFFQGYVCKDCKKPPVFWEFHHIGDRSNNSASNCEGLCPNCHAKKSIEKRVFEIKQS